MIAPEIEVLRSERSSRLEQTGEGQEKKVTARIDMDVDVNSIYDILYEERPFSGDEIRDCYTITRHRRTFRLDDSLGRIPPLLYNDPIPEIFLNRRSQARDIGDQRYNYKLARPAAFAEMILESWSNVLDIIPDQVARTSVVVGDAVDAGGGIDIGDVLAQALEAAAEEGEGIEINKNLIGSGDSMLWKKLQSFGPDGRLKLAQARPGLLGAADFFDDGRNAPSAYDYVADGFLAKISRSVAKSRFFNLENIAEIERGLTAILVKQINEDSGEECLGRPNPLIDFDDIWKEVIRKYKESLCDPKYDPEKETFLSPGLLKMQLRCTIFLHIDTL